ncbi:MAG TPA: hypothetical protein VNC50_17705, partial [Planctomycetia bacterium]|nr:hypothetical protein [Planctomycetia bacterium]
MSERRSLFLLMAAGAALLGGAWWLSKMPAELSPPERAGAAIPLMVGLLLMLGAVHLGATRVAESTAPGWRAWGIVIAVAIAARAMLLATTPILEIDLYRYLWDGECLRLGVNPFSWSPAEIRAELADPDPSAPAGLRRLGEHAARDLPAQDILLRVHFADVPTIYPPTAQSVFAAVARWTAGAPRAEKVRAWKAFALAWELAACIATALLLRAAGLNPLLAIVFLWSPLALKEIANSGHLDSLAVALAAFAVLATPRRPALAGLLLALAAGAKLYPVALLPLLILYPGEAADRVRRRLIFAMAFAIASAAIWAPFLKTESGRTPFAGLGAFAKDWEMNGAIFSLVRGNLVPTEPGEKETWFTVMPEPARKTLAAKVDPERSARVVVGMAWVAIAGWAIVRMRRAPSAASLQHACFQTLVWLWLLAPTGNPWYLTWALPFLAGEPNRVWRWLPALAPLYYLRFWFEAQGPTPL